MIQFRCKCGKVLKAKPEYAGRKLKCPGCQAALRIPEARTSASDRAAKSPGTAERRGAAQSAAPAKRKKKRSRPVAAPDDEYEELEEYTGDDDTEFDDYGDDFDDGYGDYDDYDAPALPTRKKKKSSKKKSGVAAKAAASSGDSAIPPKVMYSLFALAGVVVIVVFSLIGRSIMMASEASAAAQALPETFDNWKHEQGNLSSAYPSDWMIKAGGGTGGIPPWASFENEVQEVKITIRGSVSGTAVSDIATSGGTVPGDLGEELPDELDPIAAVHQFQHDKISAEYDEYEESEPRPIDSGFGEGRISDYTGTKVFSSEYGVRATLVSNQYQFNVVCRCPKDRLAEYKPIFEKIINSIGR